MPASDLSRRRLLRSAGASVASVALLSGCDLDIGGSQPNSRKAPSRPDPDTQVVTAARAELTGLITTVSATPRHAVAERAALLASHHTQLAALGGSFPAHTNRSRPIPVARLRRAERRAADRFARWAATAHSGDLARVLASVSAGIRMQPILRGSA